MDPVDPEDHEEIIDRFLKLVVGKTTPRGVVHVGAHWGQEVDAYRRHGFEGVLLIEANPDSYRLLQDRFDSASDVSAFHYAIADVDGTVDLHIHTSKNGSTEPSSLLELKRFKDIVRSLEKTATIRVPSLTLDSFVRRHQIDLSAFNFLNIDVQGAEMLVLEGARDVLSGMDAVLVEVNVIEMYEAGAVEEEIVDFLTARGFARCSSLYHELHDDSSSFPAWGESLFLREPA